MKDDSRDGQNSPLLDQHLDTAVSAMALTAPEMTKYKETSEGGLAVSLVRW